MKRFALLLVAPLAASTFTPAMAQNAQQPPPQPGQQQSATPDAAQGVAAPAPAPDSQLQQAQAPQWVNAGAPAGAFPPPPGQAPMISQQQIQAAFPKTNHGAAGVSAPVV